MLLEKNDCVIISFEINLLFLLRSFDILIISEKKTNNKKMCTYRLQSTLHWHVWLNEIWLVLLGTGTRHHRQLMRLLSLNYIHPVIYHRQLQSEESQV